MRNYKEILEKHGIKPKKYKKIGKVMIASDEEKSVAIKPRNRNQNLKIYHYLESRNFHYYPKRYSNSFDDYEVTEYVESIDMPKEQKMMDLVELASLLHAKTTHYKEVDLEDYKKLYEDIHNNILYLQSDYRDLITLIEQEVFMSPSDYLLARNITKIFSALQFCEHELEEWYQLVKEKRKQRVVVLHNNLELSHFIRNNQSYFINWEKAKIDSPVFDLYKLYKRSALDFDFDELMKKYERGYSLLEEERKLFFILISLPDKLEKGEEEYKNTLLVNRMIDYLYKTDLFLSPYYTKERINQ